MTPTDPHGARLPCPESGEERLVRCTEDCRLNDGQLVERLQVYKCLACDARFFDDEAMHRFQDQRMKHAAH